MSDTQDVSGKGIRIDRADQRDSDVAFHARIKCSNVPCLCVIGSAETSCHANQAALRYRSALEEVLRSISAPQTSFSVEGLRNIINEALTKRVS